MGEKGLVEILLSFICDKRVDFEGNKDYENLYFLIIKLFLALLENGNNRIQTKIFEFFMNNKEHHKFF